MSAAKIARASQTIVRHRRDGEGFLVPVQKRALADTLGQTQVELSIDLNNAPVPQRRYHAKVAQVVANGDSISLLFGQLRVGQGRRLRSLIDVSMTPDAVRQFMSTCVQFHPLMHDFLQKNGIERTSLAEIDEEPEHTVSMVVNLVAAAMSGREAVMDMYHMSAFSLREVRDTDQIGVDPVVRIDLSTALLAGLLDRLGELAHTFPGETR